MRHHNYFSRASRVLVIVFSICILFFLSLCWSLSSTLLNPDFYKEITETDQVMDSFDEVSNRMPEKQTIVFSSQAIQHNVLSLVDGVIRYITMSDMSLSNISLEDENVQTLRSALSSIQPDQDMPDISRIHPYVLTYFMPDSQSIYRWLQMTQTGFTLFRFIYPALLSIVLFSILISKQPAENTRIALFTAGSVLIMTGLFIRLFQNSLFLVPLKNVLPDSVSLFQPFISEMTYRFLIQCFYIGGILFLPAMVFFIKPVRLLFNRSSKKLAVIFILIAGVLLIIFRYELITHPIRYISDPVKNRQVYTLTQNEETIHSLVIKLREDGTNRPARNVRVIVTGVSESHHPVLLSVYTDIRGNAQFILPQGEFHVYADELTVPSHYIPFQPVTIVLDKPDHSWYTLHLQRNEAQHITEESLTIEHFHHSGRPAP